MYKDKPNFPASRRKGTWRRKRTYGYVAVVLIILLWWTGILSWRTETQDPVPKKAHEPATWVGSPKKTSSGVWDERRDAVRDAFTTSWDGYEKYAWGLDEYYPVSKKGRNMVEGGIGWIIVDALDTMIMMNLTSRVKSAREWIATSLNYEANHEVNTFETTIRMLGGLLSAHWLSNAFPDLAPLRDDDVNQPGEDLYIEKATDLADRLLGAYDTNSGVPYASVNLNTSLGIPSHGDGGASSTAEAATLQLEMKYLSKLTGETLYWEKAEKVIEVIDSQHRVGGLLPIYIYPTTGEFRGENIRLGSRGDSYYEYLIKQYLQTSKAEPLYLDMWNETLDGIKKHLITYTQYASLTVLAERQSGLDQALTPKMDHLVCFMPGTIALAVTGGQSVEEAKARLGSEWTAQQDEDMRLAEELMKTCWGMYKITTTGLAPEISYFHVDSPPRSYDPTIKSADIEWDSETEWKRDYDIHANDVHNLQRPETVESLFYMYRITRNPMYREWGWQMFQAFDKYTQVLDENGVKYAYTSLLDASRIPPTQKDNMESFWLAETLKYFYLLFSDEDFFPLDNVVINTEAHFLPRFELGKVLKTGWKRKKGKWVEESVREEPQMPTHRVKTGMIEEPAGPLVVEKVAGGEDGVA
jgi:endoplasmic reticulum Man9GlcNAc2 1,2-alpha-mannosidase